jgi:hypothetical protein
MVARLVLDKFQESRTTDESGHNQSAASLKETNEHGNRKMD